MRKRRLTAPLTLFLLLTGCSDIFVEDLEQEHLPVHIPQQQHVYPAGLIEFWWEQVLDSDRYYIQLVKPSFDLPESLLLDTLVVSTKFKWSLLPGPHELRIKACNSATCTEWNTIPFLVDSLVDYSQQTILLLSPTDSIRSGLTSIFTWIPVHGTVYYHVQILNAGSGQMLEEDSTQQPLFSYLFPGEGLFQFKVRGLNAVAATQFSEKKLRIDTTRPSPPTLISPADSAIQTGPDILFKWTLSEAGLSWLELSADSLFSSTTVVETSDSSASTGLSPGTSYWRVRTEDLAGNQSGYSQRRVLYVQ